MRVWTFALATIVVAFGAYPAAAQNPLPFLPGDIVIYRVGDGTASLANTGNAVFLDEYSPTFAATGAPMTATLRQSIPLPTVGTPGTNTPFPLIASGTATSEGLINLSANGQFLLVPGYGTTPGQATSVVSTTSAAVPRVVGIVGASGAVDTRTAFSDWASANNPRSVSSPDGSTLYLTGASGGILLGAAGTSTTPTPQTSTQLSTTVTNLRATQITNGQLYISTSSGSTVRIGTVGTGTPTTPGQTIANLPGIPTTGSPYSFVFAQLNPGSTGPDTLYVADDTTTTGGLQKYSLVGGSWVSNGTAGTGSAIRGLTGSVSGSNVTLFATTGGAGATGGGTLFGIQDTGGYDAAFSSSTLTTLATAAANTAFRGVSFSPVPEPGHVLLACAALGGFWWRRKKSAGAAPTA